MFVGQKLTSFIPFILVLLFCFRAAKTATSSSSGAFERTQGDAESDPYAFDATDTSTAAPGTASGSGAAKLTEARLRMLSTLVSRAFQERRVEQLPIPEVRQPTTIECGSSFQYALGIGWPFILDFRSSYFKWMLFHP